MKNDRLKSILGIPYFLFLVIFVVCPVLILLYYAFTNGAGEFSLANFTLFFTDSKAIGTLIYSVMVAVVTTIVCLLIAYPVAYLLAKGEFRRGNVLLMLFVMPMWINFTLRITALKEILTLIEGNLAFHPFLNTVIGMTYDFLPFMILPIYNTIAKIDHSYIEAAQDLGANPVQVFLKAVLPLSMPGVMSGIMMVFMPTISTFAIAELLTMNNIKLFGTTIQENINNSMWNYGAALSLIMLLLIAATSLFSTDDKDNSNEGGGLW